MSRDIHAIYANGVLRPLAPLDLPEGTRVHLRVEEEKNDASSASITPAELEQQQNALDEMFRDVDRIPQTPRNDGLSGRNHDQVLYGSSK
jgi:predicted DNA-binding antitoxin AbrB/MazE fold protein